jgi:thiol-disulfide isomerase/thioredoxin
MTRRRLAALVLACAAGATLAAPPAPELNGRTLDGQTHSLSALRGKVVLLVYWSTGCAVCRDVLPELRANYAGWRGKPFEIVAVSVDARRADVQAYRELLEATVAPRDRFPMLWRGEPGHADGFGVPPRLPVAYLIDPKGQVVETFVGRIPAAAWDRIADLMP